MLRIWHNIVFEHRTMQGPAGLMHLCVSRFSGKVHFGYQPFETSHVYAIPPEMAQKVLLMNSPMEAMAYLRGTSRNNRDAA